MDVVVVGGGNSGRNIAQQCQKAGLQVAVVDQALMPPPEWPGEWVQGKGVVSQKGLVAVLDPTTGDERRLINTKAVVIAVGKLDPANLPGMMLGITKLGAQLSADGTAILCDNSGKTRAPEVFVTGSCASSFQSSELLSALVELCAKSSVER